jgi:hypothetical protein
MGFEPTTASLEGWDSTTELRPRFLLVQGSECCDKLSGTHFLTLRIQHSQLSTCLLWWAGKDSNLGSRWQQIYSLPPLATWVPARNSLLDTQLHEARWETLIVFVTLMNGNKKASGSTHSSPLLVN